MTLLHEQRRFIAVFVMRMDYDLEATCRFTGVRPSEARDWMTQEKFRGEVRRVEQHLLAALGFTPMRVLHDIASIAHSDIAQVQTLDGGIDHLPRHVRVGIKKIRYKTAVKMGGDLFTYPAEVEMHDKAWALKHLGEWFNLAEAPEVKAAQATTGDEGPKRISGLVVRPPLNHEEKDLEDLLS
jgi:hypothetical protein